MAKTVRINGRQIDIAATVDAAGLFCPMPIVKLKLAIDKVKPGEIIELLADDPAAENDIIAWSKETGSRLINLEKKTDGTITAYIEKKVQQ